MRSTFDLTNRELSIILGSLNDASGYSYRDFDNGVSENKEEFVKLFDKIHKVKQVESGDKPHVLFALKQTFNHMDQKTLYALHDDVQVEEIGNLIEKLETA